MLKFIHLFKNYYFGISFIGIMAFLIQEIPYMVMPLIKPISNPIMNMQNEIKWLEILQNVFGIVFSISTTKEKIFFSLTIIMILINFVGWILYYAGYQKGWLIVFSQFAVIPLYYLFFGLWKSNYLLVGTASVFFVIHTINGYINFMINKY